MTSAPPCKRQEDKVQQILISFIYAFVALLGTWLLNLFFRKWFDLVLWPALQDWFSRRSQKRLNQRIALLDDQLKAIEPLWKFSEPEWTIYQAQSLTFTLLGLLTHVMCGLCFLLLSFFKEPLATLRDSTRGSEHWVVGDKYTAITFVLWMLGLVIASNAVLVERSFARFRRLRQMHTHQGIEDLRWQLSKLRS
jgi:hypothetical protein